MQLTLKQSANGTASASHGLPSSLVLPGCYYLADNEKNSSLEAAYRECMKRDSNSALFYATNDLDVAWLAEMLASLPVNSHVPLNLHRFMYNANGWAWAPPPLIGVQLCLFEIEKRYTPSTSYYCTRGLCYHTNYETAKMAKVQILRTCTVLV